MRTQGERRSVWRAWVHAADGFLFLLLVLFVLVTVANWPDPKPHGIELSRVESKFTLKYAVRPVDGDEISLFRAAQPYRQGLQALPRSGMQPIIL